MRRRLRRSGGLELDGVCMLSRTLGVGTKEVVFDRPASSLGRGDMTPGAGLEVTLSFLRVWSSPAGLVRCPGSVLACLLSGGSRGDWMVLTSPCCVILSGSCEWSCRQRLAVSAHGHVLGKMESLAGLD